MSRLLDVVENNGLEPREKATLEVGAYTVLIALSLGVGIGRWPAWTVLATLVVYLLWVIAYSEATVRVTLRGRAAGRAAGSD